MMVLEVVGRARRRLLWNELLSQGAYTWAAAFAAVILLLLAGTQILDWRWLLAIPGTALAVGLYRTFHRLPSPYRTAQMVDHRLALADTLSSAIYFVETPDVRQPEEMRENLLRQAEQICRGVDVRSAVPFRVPRALYLMGLLGLVASSLFALRYGVSHRLDLHAPLASILKQHFGVTEQVEEAVKRDLPRDRKSPLQDSGLALGDDQNAAGDALPDSAVDASAPQQGDGRKSGTQKADKKGADGEQMQAGDDGESSEDGESSSGEQDGSDRQAGQPSKKGQPQNASKQDSGSAGDKSSLMAKFKDAMQNLLNKMKQQPTGAGAQQQSQMAQNGRNNKGQQGNGKQNGRQGQQRSNNAQDSDAQDGQQGQEGQSSENAQSRAAGQNANEQASKQPGSGIGKNDGNKDTKLAEQLAAMGKISEIIGKRAANVTGEATIEVQNSNQQLSTPYAQRRAQHAEAGVEISRDEVPVALQGYVEHYFDAVRKQAPHK